MNNFSIDQFVTHALRSSRRLFPDHEPYSYFEAFLPVWCTDIQCVVLEASSLTPWSEYALKALSLGVGNSDELSHFLSLDDHVVSLACSELISHAFIDDSYLGSKQGRVLSVTSKSKDYLNQRARIRVSKRHKLTVHVNCLTERFQLQDFDAVAAKQASEKALYTLPDELQGKEIYTGSIDHNQLNAIAEVDNRIKWKGRVANVQSVDQRYKEYIPGYLVVNLRQKQTDVERFTIFKGREYLEAESQVLTRLRTVSESSLIPGDAYLVEPTSSVIESPLKSFSNAERSLARNLVSIERDIRKIEIDASQNADDPHDDSAEITKLIKTREEINEELAKESKGEAGITVGPENRQLLFDTIDNAQTFLVIISPWISEEAVNDEVIGRLLNAFKRGVYVDFVWGFGADDRSRDIQRQMDNERKTRKAQTVLRRIRDKAKQHYAELFASHIRNTHEKFIFTDKIAVNGNMNFLSYDGMQSGRRDSSTWTTRENDMEMYQREIIKKLVPLKRWSKYLN